MLNAFYLLNIKLIKGHRGTKLAKEKTFWAYYLISSHMYVCVVYVTNCNPTSVTKSLRRLSDTQITIFTNHVTAYDCPELISFMDSSSEIDM